MSQDVTIRMPDGTTRQISDTHEPKTSSVTTPGGKTIELVEWVPKSQGLEKAMRDSKSWDELSAPKPADFDIDLEAELAVLIRRARELQRANFNLIQLSHDAAAFGLNEAELEKIWIRIDAIRAELAA